MTEEPLSLLQSGPEWTPEAAFELAQRANAGDFQSALSLARLASECPSLPIRRSLCQQIREITHGEALQVALLYLLSELAKRPERALEVVLGQLADPSWQATLPPHSAPTFGSQDSISFDLHSLESQFASSENSTRRSALRQLIERGEVGRAFCLPLNADEWHQLWPHLASNPEMLRPHLWDLPLALLSKVRPLFDPPDLPAIPEDLDLLGWATLAPSLAFPRESVSFETYPSDALYLDSSDGALEQGSYRVRFDENYLEVTREEESVLRLEFQRQPEDPDYQSLAQHDRFFSGLTQRTPAHPCSLSLSEDGSRLAIGTVDGAVRLYQLPQGRLLKQFHPGGHPSQDPFPVRVRLSSQGDWLGGVRHGHYFLQDQLLDSLPADPRGLFVQGQSLWGVFRDGSVARLDPFSGLISLELPPGGVLPALSPDRRFLASHNRTQLQVFLLEDRGLTLIRQLPAPFPFRMNFSKRGQALILRIADPHKPGLLSALQEHSYCPGFLSSRQIGRAERLHYLGLAERRPSPVWDFLVRLSEVQEMNEP